MASRKKAPRENSHINRQNTEPGDNSANHYSTSPYSTVHMYASVNTHAQCLIQYTVLFYKCLPGTVGIFSQVHLISDSVAVQCLRLCWHNLPRNNGLMCPHICMEWEKHSPKSAVLYACSHACGA